MYSPLSGNFASNVQTILLQHNLPCLETLIYIYVNVTWKMAQMKYKLVAQMKYYIFQKLVQMQYARKIIELIFTFQKSIDI